jgi:hypothetical protein
VIDGVDESITEFEKDLLGELRARLKDLKGLPGTSMGIFPSGQGSTQVSTGVFSGVRRRAKRGFSKPLYQPQRFGPTQQDEASVVKRHVDMYNRYIACDFRLVRFLRARRMNVGDRCDKMIFSSGVERIVFGCCCWLLTLCFPSRLCGV